MLNVENVFGDKRASLERSVACLRSQQVSLQTLLRQCGIQLRKTGPNNDDGRGKFVREVSGRPSGHAPARYTSEVVFLGAAVGS
jgi:hypothetical protein